MDNTKIENLIDVEKINLYLEACSSAGLSNTKCHKCGIVYNSAKKEHHKFSCENAITQCPYHVYGCSFTASSYEEIFMHSKQCIYGDTIRCPECGISMLCCEKLNEKKAFIARLKNKYPKMITVLANNVERERYAALEAIGPSPTDEEKVNTLKKITLEIHKVYECPTTICRCPYQYGQKQCMFVGPRSFIEAHMEECLVETINQLAFCPGCCKKLTDNYKEDNNGKYPKIAKDSEKSFNKQEVQQFFSSLSIQMRSEEANEFKKHASSCQQFKNLVTKNIDSLKSVVLRDESIKKIEKELWINQKENVIKEDEIPDPLNTK